MVEPLPTPDYIGIAQDDDLRMDLLEIVTAPLCAHIAESQMISNPVVAHMNRTMVPTAGDVTPLSDWRYEIWIIQTIINIVADMVSKWCLNCYDC
jgi:hypothetical protein